MELGRQSSQRSRSVVAADWKRQWRRRPRAVTETAHRVDRGIGLFTCITYRMYYKFNMSRGGVSMFCCRLGVGAVAHPVCLPDPSKILPAVAPCLDRKSLQGGRNETNQSFCLFVRPSVFLGKERSCAARWMRKSSRFAKSERMALVWAVH